MRRITAFTITLLLILTLSVSATTAPTGGTTTGVTDTTVSTTVTGTGTQMGSDSTDTTGTTNTTIATTTTTTTAKPTDPRVKSVQYAVKELPDGAIIHGNEPQWTDGRNGGKALLFDGDTNYIEVDIQKQTAPFTLSMWVNWQANIHAENADGQRLFTICKQNTENGLSMTPWLIRETENGDIINGIALFSAYFKDRWQLEDMYYPTTTAISNMLSTNTWHHIAVTVNGSTVIVYIDGIQWMQKTLPFTYADLGADTLLIGSAGNSICLFKGLMEDVQLFENALTPAQIVRLSKDIDPFDATVTETPYIYTPAPLPETIVTEQTYRVISAVEENGVSGIVEVTPGGAFWESPVLSGGQNVTCTLLVENKSKHLTSMSLKNISLPAKGTPAWNYLSEIHVTVSSVSDVIYSGPYTDMTAAALQMQFDKLAYGRYYTYTITLSRDLTAKAEYTATSVPWEFTAETVPAAQNALPGEKPLIWLLILLPLSAVAVGFSLYWAVVKKRRRIFTVWDTLIGGLLQKIKPVSTEEEESTQSSDEHDAAPLAEDAPPSQAED